MSDLRKRLRRKTFWSVADFAAYTGATFWESKRRLQRWNEELGGMLLRPSRGRNRRYTFAWRAVARQFPEAFDEDPIDVLTRVDAIEDDVAVVKRAQHMLASQTGQNTRDIAKMRSGSGRAA